MFLLSLPLPQVGLYRISGQERHVKELKEKLIRGKTLPPLHKVEDINVITGVLKDFLRNLPEPLLTFHLNKVFMEAAGEFQRLVERRQLYASALDWSEFLHNCMPF